MSFHHNPTTVMDGLIFCVDAANPKSYVSGSSTWVDIKNPNVTSGSFVNSPPYSTGSLGSISFNGSNEYVSTNLTGVFSQITFEFWGFFDDPSLNTKSRDESAFGDWQGNRVHFGTRWSVGMHFNVNGSWTEIPTTNLRYGWNHYLLVYDDTNNARREYLNGILSLSRGTNGNMTLGDFRIGVATNLNRYYRGNIALFKAYNRPFTQEMVTHNYNALKGRFGL